MTEEELQAIETALKDKLVIDGIDTIKPSVIGALVGEVRRLRGLIKEAEFVQNAVARCPWCGGDRGWKHSECRMFSPEGVVK